MIIPGDMGRYSYIMTGTKKAMSESMGSSCHGAGRLLSRSAAKRKINGAELKNELFSRGIIVLASSMSGLAEEAPQAYKDCLLYTSDPLIRHFQQFLLILLYLSGSLLFSLFQ